jgi:hypothetical protein
LLFTYGLTWNNVDISLYWLRRRDEQHVERNDFGEIRGPIPALTWRYWEKTQNIKTAGLRADIWRRGFQATKPEGVSTATFRIMLRLSLFWEVVRMVVCYWSTAWLLKVVHIGFLETSLTKYQITLRNIREGQSLKYTAAEAWNFASTNLLDNQLFPLV